MRHRPCKYLGSDDGSPETQENRIAEKLGGRRVGGSGASMYSKGDVRNVKIGGLDFLVECKQTKHGSLSVKWDWLSKITKEAMAVECEPALSVEIKGGKECHLTDRDWIMLPARVLEELIKGD